MSARLMARVPPVLAGIGFLVLWEALVRLLAAPVYILPGPLLIAETLWTDGGPLFRALGITFGVTVTALITATAGGALLAVVMAQSRMIERSLFPYAVAAQVTPVVAIAPLIIIWVDNAFAAQVACAWIVAFFPIVSNTMVGLKSADRNLSDLFRLYGARRWQVHRLLRFPAALPYFLAGLRISGGLALIGAVVAEYVAGIGGSDVGLATRIMEAGHRLETARVFAGLVLLSVTGILIYLALDLISRRLLRHWHESAETGPD
jgi:NitT/TauT family transport system permease protein